MTTDLVYNKNMRLLSDFIRKFPWEKLPPNFNWVCQQNDGGIWACTEKPELTSERWSGSGNNKNDPRKMIPVNGLFSDWKESLQQIGPDTWIAMDDHGHWGNYVGKPETRDGYFLTNPNGTHTPLPIVMNWEKQLFARP